MSRRVMKTDPARSSIASRALATGLTGGISSFCCRHIADVTGYRKTVRTYYIHLVRCMPVAAVWSCDWSQTGQTTRWLHPEEKVEVHEGSNIRQFTHDGLFRRIRQLTESAWPVVNAESTPMVLYPTFPSSPSFSIHCREQWMMSSTFSKRRYTTQLE